MCIVRCSSVEARAERERRRDVQQSRLVVSSDRHAHAGVAHDLARTRARERRLVVLDACRRDEHRTRDAQVEHDRRFRSSIDAEHGAKAGRPRRNATTRSLTRSRLETGRFAERRPSRARTEFAPAAAACARSPPGSRRGSHCRAASPSWSAAMHALAHRRSAASPNSAASSLSSRRTSFADSRGRADAATRADRERRA